MRRAIAVFGFLLCAGAADAGDQLRYRLNGLEVRATYARGSEARALAARFLSRHPVANDEPASHWTTRGSWRQTGAVHDGVSRVLQVRGEGAALEAIESAFDPRQPAGRTREPPLWLPPASRLTSQVEFVEPGASVQWVARCAWRPALVTRWLRLSAQARGWHAEAAGAASGLSLGRRGERLEVAVLPAVHGAADGGSVVVMTGWKVP